MLGIGERPIEFFRSLANAAESGVPVTRAISILAQGRPPIHRSALEEIGAKLQAGVPLSEAMAARPDEFEPWQVEIVRVGESTGRLDSAAKTIAELLEERRTFMLDLLSGFAYPLFILHVAPFMIYGGLGFAQGAFVYFFAVARFLLCFYVPAGLVYYAAKSGGLASRPLPLLGSLRKAQFCYFLSALVRAAVPLRRSLELSTQAAGIPAPALSTPGETVVGQLRRLSIFSEEELARIEIAEQSGKLDQDLGRLAAQSQEKWRAALKGVSRVLPAVLYLVIGLAVAFRIVAFYNNYFNAIDSVFR